MTLRRPSKAITGAADATAAIMQTGTVAIAKLAESGDKLVVASTKLADNAAGLASVLSNKSDIVADDFLLTSKELRDMAVEYKKLAVEGQDTMRVWKGAGVSLSKRINVSTEHSEWFFDTVKPYIIPIIVALIAWLSPSPARKVVERLKMSFKGGTP